MIDKSILRYIPKKYHHMIASLTVEKNAELNPDTGKMMNAYNVELNDGFITMDGNTEFTVYSIGYLKFSLDERIAIKY